MVLSASAQMSAREETMAAVCVCARAVMAPQNHASVWTSRNAHVLRLPVAANAPNVVSDEMWSEQFLCLLCIEDSL